MVSITSCNVWFDAPPRAVATVLATKAAVCFDGPIDFHDGQLIVNALKGRPKHTVIIVRSRGGSVDEGLDMAGAIQSNASTVVVRDFCVSSCANYIFVPAQRRYVLKGGMVGFHGGVSDRVGSNALNDIETNANLSDSQRETAKRAWGAQLRTLLTRQNALLRSLHRPTWYFAQFETGDPHYLRRRAACEAGVEGAMIIVSPDTLRSVGLATNYRGVTSLSAASARLQHLKVVHRPVCYMW